MTQFVHQSDLKPMHGYDFIPRWLVGARCEVWAQCLLPCWVCWLCHTGLSQSLLVSWL